MGGMAKVQEIIIGRRWKQISSIATAGALERKEAFHPAPAHSQLVATMSGQHTLHSNQGIIYKHNQDTDNQKKNRLQQGGMHISGESYSALVWSQDEKSPIWSGFILIQRSLSYGHNFLYL